MKTALRLLLIGCVGAAGCGSPEAIRARGGRGATFRTELKSWKCTKAPGHSGTHRTAWGDPAPGTRRAGEHAQPPMTAPDAALHGLKRQRPEWQPWLAVIEEIVSETAARGWEASVPTTSAATNRGATPRGSYGRRARQLGDSPVEAIDSGVAGVPLPAWRRWSGR